MPWVQLDFGIFILSHPVLVYIKLNREIDCSVKFQHQPQNKDLKQQYWQVSRNYFSAMKQQSNIHPCIFFHLSFFVNGVSIKSLLGGICLYICLFSRRRCVMQTRTDPLVFLWLMYLPLISFLSNFFNLIYFFDLAFTVFMYCFISFIYTLRCAEKGNETEMIINRNDNPEKSSVTVSWTYL